MSGSREGQVLPAKRRGRPRDGVLLLLALAVLLGALLLEVTPDRGGVSLLGMRLPQVCGVRGLGGFCPGCGLTRSFVLSARGDPDAFRLHPLGPLLLLVVAGQVPYRLVRIVRRREAGDERTRP